MKHVHPAGAAAPNDYAAPYAATGVRVGVRGVGDATYVFVITEPDAAVMDPDEAYELGRMLMNVAAQARLRASSTRRRDAGPDTMAT